MPGILMFSVVGSFAINNSISMWDDAGDGVIGYSWKRTVFRSTGCSWNRPRPIVEKNFMMSMIKTDWTPPILYPPVSAILCIITFSSGSSPLRRRIGKNQKENQSIKKNNPKGDRLLFSSFLPRGNNKD